MARRPVITGFPARAPIWRHIGGLDFQQVRPYVLVAQPDRSRPHMYLWLRKISRHGEAALWSVKVVRGDTPLSERRAHSAAAAVAAGLDDDTLRGEPARAYLSGHGPDRDPYPSNYGNAPAGWYADRATAHDGRWDSRTGVR